MQIHRGRSPKFSVASVITLRRKLYIPVHEDSIKTAEVTEFLEHPLRHIRQRLILRFWDGENPHRSKLTQAFLRAHPRIEAHRFPGYSPELNPEWVWQHLKKHELASYAPNEVKELRQGLRQAVVRIRGQPELIRSFVAATHLYDGPTDASRSGYGVGFSVEEC